MKVVGLTKKAIQVHVCACWNEVLAYFKAIVGSPLSVFQADKLPRKIMTTGVSK